MDERRKRKLKEYRAKQPNLCRVVDELMKSKDPKRMAALLCLFLESRPEVLIDNAE